MTLRRGDIESPFRQALLQLCSANTGGGLLLCSGYIWEELVSSYSISIDSLSAAIKVGVRRNPITLIAGNKEKNGQNMAIGIRAFKILFVHNNALKS